MEITIQAIKFDATEKLNAYIEKKAGKLAKFFDKATAAEVKLKVIKPETNANKQVELTLKSPSQEFFASKIADTFEQAIDECIMAIEKQIEKKKKKSFKSKVKSLLRVG
ncbi:MAG: ribosome-associated translation inhibitor RaiA [Prevotellaceae bacterium]|jgi:putative sigma-54 modulation protein|nr:ribosome-associated translation inhibitor RaiA [Prevotellaceae bacterium]